MIDLRLGDCLQVLKDISNNSVDAIVTDPPYGLVSVVKRFGGKNSRNTPAMETKDGGVFARKARGFMGKEWDGTGIENNVEMWGECLRVLKPGGHLLSFGGTRTYHRMASAIEDAGFEIRDMIEWVYGSGFPKSHNIGKAVDKLQGNERVVVGKSNRHNSYAQSGIINPQGNGGIPDLTKGTSEWEGWGTALKPAHEPICMARKPLSEKTVAKNVLKWGTGGINIDGSRVEGKLEGDPNRFAKTDGGSFNAFSEKPPVVRNEGRFPANLIHDGSDEVRECFPNESERFFKSIIYEAKASKRERNEGCEELEDRLGGSLEGGNDKRKGDRPQLQPTKNNHPTVKPVKLMEYLIRMVTPPEGTVLDPFMGSGTTGVACKRLGRSFIGIELNDEYFKICQARLDNPTQEMML